MSAYFSRFWNALNLKSTPSKPPPAQSTPSSTVNSKLSTSTLASSTSTKATTPSPLHLQTPCPVKNKDISPTPSFLKGNNPRGPVVESIEAKDVRNSLPSKQTAQLARKRKSSWDPDEEWLPTQRERQKRAKTTLAAIEEEEERLAAQDSPGQESEDVNMDSSSEYQPSEHSEDAEGTPVTPSMNQRVESLAIPVFSPTSPRAESPASPVYSPESPRTESSASPSGSPESPRYSPASPSVEPPLGLTEASGDSEDDVSVGSDHTTKSDSESRATNSPSNDDAPSRSASPGSLTSTADEGTRPPPPPPRGVRLPSPNTIATERERREAARGSSFDRTTLTPADYQLFTRLTRRGFEPLLPKAWRRDFPALPIELFTADTAYVSRPDMGASLSAGPLALEVVLDTGMRVRNALKNKLNSGRWMRLAVRRAMQWAGCCNDEVDPAWNHEATRSLPPVWVLVMECGTESASSLHDRALDALRARESAWAKSVSAGAESGVQMPQGLYGVVVSGGIMAFVSYLEESARLRTIAMFDFTDVRHDVWNAFAVMILAVHCRAVLLAAAGVD